MYLFFVRLWYRLTMAWTRWRKPTALIPTVTSIDEIPPLVEHGTRWDADPKFADYLAHPRCFQARIDAGKSFYDCEDHATYWAVLLLKSKLCKSVGLGFVYWTTSDGKRPGHAVVVFEGLDGKRYWADYHDPVLIHSGPWWAYGGQVVHAFGGEKLRKVAYLEITGLKDDDTPVFKGEHKVHGHWF